MKHIKAYGDGPYGQMHYRIVSPPAASRVPLVCLHITPISGVVYENLMEAMGADRIVVAPDTPGYGGSAPPPAPVGIPEFARAMVGLMDQLNLKHVDLMGYHTGDFIATELARTIPDRVRKVVMISAPLFTTEELDTYRKLWYGDAKSHGETPPTFAEAVTEMARVRGNGNMGFWRGVPTEERFGEIMTEWMRSYRREHWGHEAVFAYDLAKYLPEVKQPILVLRPQDDLWEHTLRARPHMKNGRFHDLPGYTHGFLDSHTEEIAGLLRAFLDRG